MGEDKDSSPKRPALDVDWDEFASVPGEDAADRATAVPPAPYEQFARRITASPLTDDETKRALAIPSTPNLARIRESLPTPVRDEDELDDALPLLDEKSDPNGIPLEMREPDPLHTPLVPAPDSAFDAVPPTIPNPFASQAKVHEHIAPSAFEQPTKPGVVLPTLDSADIPTWIPDQFDSALGDHDLTPQADVAEAPSHSSPPTLRGDELGLGLPDTDGGAMDLVEAKARDSEDPLMLMRDRYAVGDFSGALESAQTILATQPSNEEALRYVESCSEVLIQMFSARLGSPSQVPHLALPPDELQWLSLDHRAGFILSLVDGYSTIEEILDMSGMPRLETLRTLHSLVQREIIQVGEQ